MSTEHEPQHSRPGLSRRAFLGSTFAVGSMAAAGLLSGCGSSPSSASGESVSGASGSGGSGSASAGSAGSAASSGTSGGSGTSSASGVPSYYPSNYSDIVDAAKKEGGELTVYSNMDVVNWKPIIAGFQKLYPFVTSVSTNNLDSSEVFQKYYSENSAGKSPASLLVSGDPANWIRFAKGKHALEYDSPETSHLPDFGNPQPGLYTFSADPILMAWNKALLTGDKVPTGVGDLGDLVKKDPGTFKNTITTYDIGATSFGFAIDWSYVKDVKGAWSKLQAVLPATRPENSSGPMVDKLQSGEYVAGYFLSSTVVFPAVAKNSTLLGWSYIDDGTPIFLRGMAIAKTAPAPATAKLMLDYILSKAGQQQVFAGGFTPYRDDLGSAVSRTYQGIVNKVGKDNIVLINYGEVPQDTEKKFISKWEGYLGH